MSYNIPSESNSSSVLGKNTLHSGSIGNINTLLSDLSNLGGGTFYLNTGTHTLTEDLIIPSGVRLEGNSRDECFIDCGDYTVRIEGTDVYDTGTVTISNGQTTVVGSGTTFTAGMVGQYILLDGLFYIINTFTDTTHLEIDTYAGDDLAGALCVIATPNNNGQLSKVTVINSIGAGISLKYCNENALDDVIVYDCATGIDIQYAVFPVVKCSSVYNGVNLNMNYAEGFFIDYSEFNYSTTGEGITMTNSKNATMFNSSVTDNTGTGTKITDGSKIAFISCDISGNGGDGMEFVSGNHDNQITSTIFNGNVGSGLKLTATSDNNSFSQSSTLNNGAYGINIAAATCDNNILIGVIAGSNTSGSISDSGTGTLKSALVNILP